MNKKITKKEMEEYDKEVSKKSRKFKLEPIDFHNLYDLFWMIDSEVWDTLKLNKMDKWFHNFTARVERILFDEDFALDLKK